MDLTLPLWVYYVIGFPLLLGPLVTVHELGHYLVGRWFGVHAEAFSIGFGKEIWGFTDKRGTRWKLALLPLGGYVQFKGDMNPASIPDAEAIANATVDERVGSFHHAALWKRALIVFAGPATNILLTLAIFASFFAFFGKPVPADAEQQLTISTFAEQSPAREAGLKVGDRIVSIDGEAVHGFRDVQDAILLYPGRTLDITVLRGGTELTIPVTAGSHEITDKFGNVSRIGLVGIAATDATYAYEPQGLVSSLGLAVDHSLGIVDMMVTGIGQIVSGERSVKELGGPVKIAKYSGEQLSLGSLAFINFVALISLNLAFINLLPIPALDGGHLAFYAAEAVRRKPVGPRGQEVAYRAGVALVLMLMIFVTVNDLAGLPVFGK
ncbi:RIP metalloprotease RseP [Erythrobacter mangrovi]|uniref:RIP metalloprotease RseP n=1 Tax=Erythrobacter mangrovi TaxID=2739433 RepID=UPI001F3D2B7E|nr:RIP metalloprotease RseP [Erythrobacter mangrovi]